MKAIPWNEGWQYSNGRPGYTKDGAKNVKMITLPHDAQISTDTYAEAPAGSATGFYGGGVAVYTKRFDVPTEWKDQRVMLQFDGVYQNSEVVINGHLVACHHYGYTPFLADLTPYLYFHRTNRVEVMVNNTAQPNSRWYSGTGIYRPVNLLVSPAVHVEPYGIYAYTKYVVNGMAFVMVEVTVANDKAVHIEEMVDVSVSTKDAGIIAQNSVKACLDAKERAVIRVPMYIKDAPIWDIDNPKLCTLHVSVADDEADTNFGIRTLTWDKYNGMQLNGRTIKLKGGCVHHDNGTLGAASFYDSEYRKMKLHKDNGYNAIRTAHNPPSAAMLDACDALGLLVMDEAFDVWRMGMVQNDYRLYFESDWQSDMEAFIKRDRNHPCIVLWSTGNEIIERAGLSRGNHMARELADFVRKLDVTRPVTNAINSLVGALDDEKMEDIFKKLLTTDSNVDLLNYIDNHESWEEETEGFASPLDIVGYNYSHDRYERAGKIFPERIIVGSESAPMEIANIWAEVEKYPYVIGDFTWTSYDYLGEAGIGRTRFMDEDTDPRMGKSLAFRNEYPWRTANDADFDICGFDCPQLHYRKIVWGSAETYIAVHVPAPKGQKEIMSQWSWPMVISHWNWRGHEGKPIKISVYTAADEVELFCNGVSVGRATAEKFSADFEIPYVPGTLTAVSSTAGKEVSRHEIATTGEVVSLKCTVEPGTFKAGEQSLAFVTIEAVDAGGNRVPTAAIPAKATVRGAATLQAFAAAKPDTAENYTTGSFTSYEGRWQAVLRSGIETGTATLRVEAEGLEPVEITLNVI